LVMPEAEGVPDFSEVFRVGETFCTTEARRHRGKERKNGSQLLDGVTVAVARDAAFCFIYAENVAWLQQEGACVQFFSPLAGEPVPQGADGLWLPGGYPELHGPALSQSTSWDSVRTMIDAGKPVLAECGGMMVLGASMIPTGLKQGLAMAGVLACDFMMQERLAGLGYREDASGVRGHEFHHSIRTNRTGTPSYSDAFVVKRGDAGMRYKNLRASYIHWYFPSQPKEVASWLSASVVSL